MAPAVLVGHTMRNMNERGLGQALHGGHHYENFPVASWLLPRQMRRPVLALYAFARTGDDLADEGTAGTEARIQALAALRSGLRDAAGSEASDSLREIGRQLGRACADLRIAVDPAESLLEAFEYDAAFRPFADWQAVYTYCAKSANPVGRLVLAFAGLENEPPQQSRLIHQCSDAVCTGLQLVNFAQDFGEDLGRQRPTLPQALWPEEWHWNDALRVLEERSPLSHHQRKALPQLLAQEGIRLIDSAAQLPRLLRRSGLVGRYRLALEIALTMAGGRTIGQAVLRDPIAPWTQSPRLSRLDLLRLVPPSIAACLGAGARPAA